MRLFTSFKKKPSKVFGVSLQELVDRENESAKNDSSHKRKEVPEVVTVLVGELEKKCIVEGVFRVAGSVSKVNQLVKKIDKGEVSKIKFDEEDVHTLCSLLKKYFRDLPDPLIPSSLTQEFVSLLCIPEDEEDEEDVQNMKKLLKKLPNVNLNVLKLMAPMISNILEESNVTKMDSGNLGTCLGPSISHPKDAKISDIVKLNTSTSFLLRNLSKALRDEERGRTKTDQDILSRLKKNRPKSTTLDMKSINKRSSAHKSSEESDNRKRAEEQVAPGPKQSVLKKLAIDDVEDGLSRKPDQGTDGTGGFGEIVSKEIKAIWAKIEEMDSYSVGKFKHTLDILVERMEGLDRRVEALENGQSWNEKKSRYVVRLEKKVETLENVLEAAVDYIEMVEEKLSRMKKRR